MLLSATSTPSGATFGSISSQDQLPPRLSTPQSSTPPILQRPLLTSETPGPDQWTSLLSEAWEDGWTRL